MKRLAIGNALVTILLRIHEVGNVAMPDAEMLDATEKKDWVCITSKEGFSFIVPRKVACQSGTIRASLSEDSNFAEALSGTYHVEERPIVVQKVLEYLSFKTQYENAGPKDEIPDFTERIPPEIALELLMASDFLEA